MEKNNLVSIRCGICNEMVLARFFIPKTEIRCKHCGAHITISLKAECKRSEPYEKYNRADAEEKKVLLDLCQYQLDKIIR
jgi:hypothetical protein